MGNMGREGGKEGTGGEKKRKGWENEGDTNHGLHGFGKDKRMLRMNTK
jgi:hypothetical protein